MSLYFSVSFSENTQLQNTNENLHMQLIHYNEELRQQSHNVALKQWNYKTNINNNTAREVSICIPDSKS